MDLILEEGVSCETFFFSVSFGIQGFAYGVLYAIGSARGAIHKGVDAVIY